MNLISIFQKYPDQESCIEHLEQVRWNGTPACPHCGSIGVAPKDEGNRVGRWNCHDCKSSFNVLSGTVFSKTRMPLQKWFLAIGIVLNAKKSVSSHQLARDLDMTQPTAYRMAMQVRKAMAAGQTFLSGIVEADEAYIGGKPRKPNKREDDENAPRGRGTDKLPVVGAVERGGDVVAQPSPKVDGKAIAKFLRQNVDRAAMLVTDQYAAYRGQAVKHATIDHSVQYVDGIVHTNTIEGFWSLLKRAWYGSHHHYRKDHAGAYIVEACYKYNNRKNANVFGSFLRQAMAARPLADLVA